MTQQPLSGVSAVDTWWDQDVPGVEGSAEKNDHFGGDYNEGLADGFGYSR